MEWKYKKKSTIRKMIVDEMKEKTFFFIKFNFFSLTISKKLFSTFLFIKKAV